MRRCHQNWAWCTLVIFESNCILSSLLLEILVCGWVCVGVYEEYSEEDLKEKKLKQALRNPGRRLAEPSLENRTEADS